MRNALKAEVESYMQGKNIVLNPTQIDLVTDGVEHHINAVLNEAIADSLSSLEYDSEQGHHDFYDRTFKLMQGKHLIARGCPEFIREQIEELLEEKVGVFVSLQENEGKDGEFVFYLHSDNDEELSEENIVMLNDHYGINTHDDEAAEFAIKQLLNIKIV